MGGARVSLWVQYEIGANSYLGKASSEDMEAKRVGAI